VTECKNCDVFSGTEHKYHDENNRGDRAIKEVSFMMIPARCYTCGNTISKHQKIVDIAIEAGCSWWDIFNIIIIIKALSQVGGRFKFGEDGVTIDKHDYDILVKLIWHLKSLNNNGSSWEQIQQKFKMEFGLTDEDLKYIEYKRLLFILEELNDIEVIILKSYVISSKSEYYELHKNILTEPLATEASAQDVVDMLNEICEDTNTTKNIKAKILAIAQILSAEEDLSLKLNKYNLF